MSLEQAAYLSQVVAGLAVLASLIFVGVQIRQNTRSQKVVAVDSLAAAIAAINVPAMESPAVGEALSNALHDWGSATREQRIIAHFFLFSFFKLHESAWYQRKTEVLDAAQWTGWDILLRVYYHSEGVRTGWWPHRRHAYSPDFQAYLAQTKPPPGDIGTLNDLFDNLTTRASS
jgi:hypothetical protein